MTDYQARFTAGARAKTVSFRLDGAQTKQQLERVAWSRLRGITSLPAENWTLTNLGRVLHQAADDEDGPQ